MQCYDPCRMMQYMEKERGVKLNISLWTCNKIAETMCTDLCINNDCIILYLVYFNNTNCSCKIPS